LLRLSVAPERGFGAWLADTRRALAEARERGPLAALVAAMTARAPDCQVYFHGEVARSSAPGLDLGLVAHELELAVDPREGRLLAAYATGCFDEDTVARLLGHWESLLAAALADPERPVAALPLLTVDEQRALARTWDAAGPPRLEA